MRFQRPGTNRGVGAFACRVALLLGLASMAAVSAEGPHEQVDRYARYLRDIKGIAGIKTLLRMGEGPNYIDLVIVSAGFHADRMQEFYRLCETLVKGLFAQPPWDRYKSLFNVHAVFVADESPDVSRVKVQGFKGNILHCDNGLAIEYSRYAADSGITVVIHNSSFSTSSNGYWGVIVHHKGAAVEPMASMHELGHGFAGLGDEYIQRNTPFDGPPSALFDSVNVTAEEHPRLSKWHYWLEETWPGALGPQKRPSGANVENAEGAGWIKRAYRPEKSCVMRGNSAAYCVVCNETLEANFFRYIDLFKAVEPAKEDLVLWQGEQIEFRLTAIDLLCQPPEWLKSRLDLYLDGAQIATSDRGEVSHVLHNVAPGVHQLGANLNVQADTIRRDFSFLSRNKGWRVTVVPHAKPRIAVTPLVAVAADGTVDVPVIVEHATPALFTLKMANAPAGAILENGRFKWKPNGANGSWRVNFSALNEQQLGVTEPMEIQVAGGQGDNTIEVPSQEPVDLVTGKPFKFQLKASTKDGGHLLYEPVQVLPGVEVNHETGELSWTAPRSVGGPQPMRFRAKNGTAAREFDIVFRVRREVTPSPIFGPYQQMSQDSLEKLKQSPSVYRRIFEPIRLLRDRFQPVYGKALTVAQTVYKDLDPRFRANFLQELNLHAWAFTSKSEVLKWMRELTNTDSSEAAVSLKRKLDEVDRYNADRWKQAQAEAALKKKARTEAMVGVVSSWQVSKIYRAGNKSANDLLAHVFPPEQGPAPDAEWKNVTSDEDGVVNIAGFFEKTKVPGPYTRCAVYLRSTAEVPNATDALLEIGSDDGVKIWINGNETFVHAVCRPLAIAQDQAKVHLKKGANTLLVKITQDHSDWASYLRIRAADGTALTGLQVGAGENAFAPRSAP